MIDFLLLAQDDFGGAGGRAAAGVVTAAFACFMLIIAIALTIVLIVGMWKSFSKAGKPGWAAIVPIYNFIVLLEIVGRPIWWILLFLVPCVNIIVLIIVHLDVAKAYGRSPGFGIGLALLGIIFWPILGFGSARYLGPVAQGS